MSLTTPILVLAGPTASGKTALAVELARKLDGEIVGADSVQVYRGFDVGSGKPTARELKGIPHHLLDVVDPDEPIDAMRFAGLADAAIDDVGRRGKAAIVVGGTGLWLRALVRGLVSLPEVDAALRQRIEAEVESDGAATSHARLAALDPRAAAKIHPNDKLRLVRALEVHAQTGRPMGELHAEHALGGPRRPTLFVVLRPSLDELTAQIDVRVDAMIASGWVDEVKALRARWGELVRPLSSVGYREWNDHLREGSSFDDAVRAVKHSTRLYARRQRNWFAAEPGVDLRVPSPREVDDATLTIVKRHLGR